MRTNPELKRTNPEQGQSLVEIALLFPMLLLVMVGILDLGRVFYAYTQITNAAREGARYAASKPADSTGTCNAAVSATTGSGFTINCGNVTYTKTGTTSGSTVTVTVQVNFQLITTYIFGVGTIPLQNSATMVVLPGGESS